MNPVAMRTCESRGVWTVLPEYGECYTFVTMMYVEINIVSDPHMYTKCLGCVLLLCKLIGTLFLKIFSCSLPEANVHPTIIPFLCRRKWKQQILW